MANKPGKELSRRDALKLLGAAAGASVLANLPSKWSTPELTAGVLPVHAQTSALYGLLCEELFYDEDEAVNEWVIGSAVTVSPVASGIPMNYVILLNNASIIGGPIPAAPPLDTDGSGQAAVQFVVLVTGAPNGVTVTWSFANPSDGTGSCSKLLILPWSD